MFIIIIISDSFRIVRNNTKVNYNENQTIFEFMFRKFRRWTSNLGVFHITNVRLIWHAELNENFNVSVPYNQTKTIKFVIQNLSENYLIRFQIALEEKLREFHREITTLHKSYFANSEFCVEFSIEDQQSDQPATRLESKVDGIEILQSPEYTDSYATYLTGAGKRDRDPVYSD
ncbi:unnamed protein product [Adineta steineri]|uniref:BBSome complex member BBS5 PH domain-containing protein n=1 Tax=Adineta steineri TaxID=433720 RepID=A0A813V325_9BILA|nr:unnamed protein product [Adineta steineri]